MSRQARLFWSYINVCVSKHFFTHLEIFFLQENCPVMPSQILWRGFFVIPLKGSRFLMAALCKFVYFYNITFDDPGLEQMIPLLNKLKGSCHWTPHWDGVLFWKDWISLISQPTHYCSQILCIVLFLPSVLYQIP